jgi:hypothetical protein
MTRCAPAAESSKLNIAPGAVHPATSAVLRPPGGPVPIHGAML